MKYFNYKLLFLSFLMFISCDSFLERPPYDNIDDSEYWQNETQIRTYSYGFYPTFFNGYGTSGLIGGSSYGNGDTYNDDIAWNVQSEFAPIRIPDSDGGWDFGVIRKANYMLAKVQTVASLSEEALNHWMGIARFFRAIQYSNMVFAYGDVPFYDKVLQSTDKDELYKDRDPRVDVDKKIMEDFNFALDNVKNDDGTLTINRYVVAAMVSRLMLREGTYLKYHNIDANVAKECISLSLKASLVVMESNKYSIADNYNSIFSSDDLNSNSEVIFYRKYLSGILTHCVLTYNFAEAQTGANKALMESYLTDKGLPVHCDASWNPTNSSDFFKNRDPRLKASFREQFYIRGEDCSPFNYSTSGYSMRKFMDDNQSSSSDLKYRQSNNETDAPIFRLGEVLLNYAEAKYELGTLTQADLDCSINVLRSRKGMSIPKLEMIGDQPAIDGKIYDDPKRDPLVPNLLWEIRRERRVELCFEGLRYSDLKRWSKLDYMCNVTNPDIRYGAYINYSDYPKANKTEVYVENGANQGFILCNRGTARQAPTEKNYVKPVPKDEIQLYKDNGYTLSQTKEWLNEK